MTDHVSLSDLINLLLEKNVPFVSFSKPGKSDTFTFIQLSGKFQMFNSIEDAFEYRGFIYAPFDSSTRFPIILFDPEIQFINENIPDSLFDELQNKKPLYPSQDDMLYQSTEKKAYLKNAQNYISSFNNDFTKAVLARIMVINAHFVFNAGRYFTQLQKHYPETFSHIINIPGAGTWVGATPETLFLLQKNMAQTVSLAGTKSVETEGWGSKEIHEQELVSQYIRRLLHSFNFHGFTENGPKTIQSGEVKHLFTQFSFPLGVSDKRIPAMISALHPTPAVCGVPKKKALRIINETESFNREYYAGFFGLINWEEQHHLMVNLRCMKISQSQFILFSGGGLTKASNPESEWNETVLKTQTLLKLIAD